MAKNHNQNQDKLRKKHHEFDGKMNFKKGNLESTVKLKQGRESMCAYVCVQMYTHWG